jgi:hypothetical protein
MMDEASLEDQLAAKKRAVEEMVSQGRHRFSPSEHKVAHDQLLRLERLVA